MEHPYAVFELPKHVTRNAGTLPRLEAAVDAWDEARANKTTSQAHMNAAARSEELVAAILGYVTLRGLSPAHVREAILRFHEERALGSLSSVHLDEMAPAERQSAGIGLLLARQIVDREFHRRNDARDAGEQAAILGVVSKIAQAIDDEIAKANERSP
jgi:hypothetical protein